MLAFLFCLLLKISTTKTVRIRRQIITTPTTETDRNVTLDFVAMLIIVPAKVVVLINIVLWCSHLYPV